MDKLKDNVIIQLNITPNYRANNIEFTDAYPGITGEMMTFITKTAKFHFNPTRYASRNASNQIVNLGYEGLVVPFNVQVCADGKPLSPLTDGANGDFWLS